MKITGKQHLLTRVTKTIKSISYVFVLLFMVMVGYNKENNKKWPLTDEINKLDKIEYLFENEESEVPIYAMEDSTYFQFNNNIVQQN